MRADRDIEDGVYNACQEIKHNKEVESTSIEMGEIASENCANKYGQVLHAILVSCFTSLVSCIYILWSRFS